jgi:transposase
VVLIWDGLSSHWSHKMRAYLDSQRDWLTAERLPAYAPELNAVEYLWANLEGVELANLPTTTLAEVADATEQGIQRVCKTEDLAVGFLAHTGLTLDP